VPVLARPPVPGRIAALALRVLRTFGWSVVLAQPVPRRCVVIFYPHTSNWDFPLGLLAKWTVGLPFRWVAKDSLFRTPLRPFFQRWGGIPVDRASPEGFIEQLRREMESHDDFRIAITPEGTRRRTEYWKSGFYRLARAAQVPLVLAFIDYPRRRVGIGGRLDLTGDVAVDMAAIAAFYDGLVGKHPDQMGPIRLREAPAAPAAAPP
jgi:1-acyl-sn-glycerol-3-phosphate acyltransferase